MILDKVKPVLTADEYEALRRAIEHAQWPEGLAAEPASLSFDDSEQPEPKPVQRGKRQQFFPELCTLREEAYCVAYVGPAKGRALVAYKMAGFTGSPASRRANASRLLGKPRVAKRIAELQAARLARLEKDGDEELAVVGDVARFTVVDLFDATGKLIPLHQLPRHIAAGIRGMRPGKFGVSLEFRDSLKACEVLLRVAGRLRDSTSVNVGVKLEDILAQSRRAPETGAAVAVEARALPAAATREEQ